MQGRDDESRDGRVLPDSEIQKKKKIAETVLCKSARKAGEGSSGSSIIMWKFELLPNENAFFWFV